MTASASRFKRWIWVLVVFGGFSAVALAQRIGVPGNQPRNLPPSNRTPGVPDVTAQPIFISGKVMLEGGGALPEPVAIERICSTTRKREGYTDNKGQFEFQLGLNTSFQDASESDGRTPAPTQIRPGSSPTRRPLADLSDCEFRAILPGYQSSVAIIRSVGDTWQYDVGTIFLKRMGDAPGTTISLTSMAAPKDAMHAYEKAQKLQQEDKQADAEKHLEKAVQVYPQFAAAWTMLGDMHRKANQFDQARTDYTHAMTADPQFVNPVFSLAVIAMQEKKWDEAVQFSNQVLKMNALAFPLAYFFNAAANYNQHNYEVAELSARKFKALDSQHEHPDICLLLSYVLSRKKDYAGAARELRDYLAAAPNAPDAEAVQAQAKRFEDLSVSAQRQHNTQ